MALIIDDSEAAPACWVCYGSDDAANLLSPCKVPVRYIMRLFASNTFFVSAKVRYNLYIALALSPGLR